MAAFFGLAHLSASLLEQQDDTKVGPDSGDMWERTPLLCAAGRGHMAVVKLLLERADVDINRIDSWENGPLSYAVMKGHVAIVQLMLARDGVDVNSKNQWGGTPLLYAVEGRHEALVKLLLERADIDVNCKRDIGPTSHMRYEREAMAKMLLERLDVDADFRDWSGLTPLRHPEIRGYEEIVKLLKDHIASH